MKEKWERKKCWLILRKEKPAIIVDLWRSHLFFWLLASSSNEAPENQIKKYKGLLTWMESLKPSALCFFAEKNDNILIKTGDSKYISTVKFSPSFKHCFQIHPSLNYKVSYLHLLNTVLILPSPVFELCKQSVCPISCTKSRQISLNFELSCDTTAWFPSPNYFLRLPKIVEACRSVWCSNGFQNYVSNS
jgi:hypothetical protein